MFDKFWSFKNVGVIRYEIESLWIYQILVNYGIYQAQHEKFNDLLQIF